MRSSLAILGFSALMVLTSADAAEAPKAPPATGKPAKLSPPQPAPTNGVWTPYKLEMTPNTLNLAQFPDAKLPPHHLAILGYGFPSFADEPRNPILKVLTIGFTHFINAGAFRDTNVLPGCQYSFENMNAMASDAADKIIKEGKYKTEYGSFEGITERKQSFGGITREGALELGKYMFFLRSHSWSPDTQSWSRPTDDGSWIMMDEEEILWQKGANASQYAGWLMEGHAMAAPRKKIGFYGHPVTWLFHNAYDNSDAAVETFLQNDRAYGFDSESWKKAAPYIDLSAGYFKIPYIQKSSLYKKDANGEYLKDDRGARIWRDDTFTEVMFGHTNHIWAEPEPDLRNFQQNDKGGGKVAPALEEGWKWTSWCGHDRNPAWQPEVKMMVDGIYRYADYIITSKLLLSKADFGDMDISHWRDARLRAYVERRPRTEPWTYGGNTRWIRETGETALKYEVMFAYLAGVQAVSTWDNGGSVSEQSIKPQGQSVYGQEEFLEGIEGKPGPHPDNYSRYVVWSAAVNTFARLMNGVPVDETLTYIRFYYPIVGSRNREVISTGIYSGTRFIVMFNYPLLDPQEKLAIRIAAGNVQYDAVLAGREVLLLNLDVPAGLTPKDFTLTYNTIDGKPVRVNGLIGGRVAEHYEE
jgi:hypothetical protein